MEKKKALQFKHRFHNHPLVLVEEQRNQNEKSGCSGCGEVVSGSSFTCAKCNYHLHKECAQASYAISNHPLHPKHSSFYLRSSLVTRPRYACALCMEKRNMFFYECFNCSFSLDFKCALFSLKVGGRIDKFKDDGHQYPFIFCENHKDEVKKFYCSWCHESLINSIYISVDRKFYFHKQCFDELPVEIDHPCHHLHTLVFQSNKKSCFCEVCQKKDDNFFYHCFACKFDIHLECLWPRLVIEDKNHEHSFTRFFRQDPFICDACGTNGKFVSYICLTCHLQVHKNCTSLPHFIKVTRHDHVVVHKYFLKKKELESCKICFNEVRTEHGSYYCSTEDCNYIVHVKCATEDENLYHVVDQAEELDETEKATISSITRVIEKNEQGEAVKIEHFSHEHILVLKDNIQEDNDRHCDGCTLSISTWFYYCSECNFFLHKTCAELPKKKHHWFHRFVATLEAKDWFWCDLCCRFCSGLCYRSGTLEFCLRCATVPNIIQCQGHEHFLFFDYKCKKQCSACGVGSIRGAFRCKKCVNFTLDFACITLPETVQHKCDFHLLKLTYHDASDQHYCDICEENRDPNLWFYYCSTCDTSVHPKCVLGKYPFFKYGSTWTPYNMGHSHKSVTFVRKVDGYLKCSVCGKLCQDEALKCSTCNLIVHIDCRREKW